jgi:predicted alpha/beta-fold hydrolase
MKCINALYLCVTHHNLKKMKLIVLLAFITQAFSMYSIKPDREYLTTPDSLGLNSKSIQIQSTDNMILQSWVLEPMGELNLKTTIIVAYGDAGNMSHWLNHSAILSQLGYTVVMFDYRGFGKSSDFNMNLNQLYYDEFTEDLISVFKWVKGNIDNNNVGIWGLSMGTIMTGFLIENNQPDFLVLEGLVVDPISIKKKIYKSKGKKIKLPKSSRGLSKIYKSTKIPLLIFSGNEDKITTSKESIEISKLATNRKFIEFKGTHLQGFNSMTENYFGDKYISEIESFITKQNGW